MGHKKRGLGRSPLRDGEADITIEDVGFLLDQLLYWRYRAHMLELERSERPNGRDPADFDDWLAEQRLSQAPEPHRSSS